MSERPAVIDVRGLHKAFGPRKVVQGLDLTVREGEVCGFLGGNGSGKTTTIRLLCGLLKPDAGEGACLGLDLLTQSVEIRRHLGYMTQKFSLYGELTVAENLDFVARLYGVPDRAAVVERTMREIGLADRAGQEAQHLSGGWRQRLALAACLMHRPRLLLLDEPTAGVDAKARREFWDIITDMAADGMTVLVSTHYMDEAERCSRVVYLAGGRLIVQGSAAEVVRDAGLAVFETEGEPQPLDQMRHALRRQPGVETAAVFGRTLRVVGKDRPALAAALAQVPAAWTEVPPRLDDVFIHLLDETRSAA